MRGVDESPQGKDYRRELWVFFDGSTEIRTEQRDENPCQVHPFARCLPIIGSRRRIAHVTINRGGSALRIRTRRALPQCSREPRLSIFTLSSPACIPRRASLFSRYTPLTAYKSRSSRLIQATYTSVNYIKLRHIDSIENTSK